MYNTQPPRRPSRSSRSSGSRTLHSNTQIATQDSIATPFRPCAATAAFFLYAQGNLVVSLQHDTLAIDRHFDKHREDVLLIAVDNVSDTGAGKFVASYDAEQTAIIWDVFTGEEIARFTAYEQIQVAAWTKDGSVAFGNSQGNIILFEPSTAEHTSARTIVDPVTALAPASDSKTFAIGYLNGSILVALLHPTFTILHTLSPTRVPSPITGLAWHGSSSKQKSDMLATQTAGGDLRIWSVSKDGHAEPPRIIRVLKGSENAENARSWFSWSKNGRIIQHLDMDTRIWDVRTKDVTHNDVADVREVAGIANYGPGAVLFTIAYDSTVQQYDVTPSSRPTIVANAQRVPPQAPPTPPDSLENRRTNQSEITKGGDLCSARLVTDPTDSSEDNAAMMSPLQKIAQDIDHHRNTRFNDEQRDFVGPLSPASSKVSGTSASSRGYRERTRHGERHSRTITGSKVSSDGTVFSPVSSLHTERESVSIRSSSSMSSSQHRASSLRHEMLRSPDEPKNMMSMDLFPFARRRQREARFRLPHYGQSSVTTDSLRQEMLNIVFGWDGNVESLIRDEHSRHKAGSASGVLLSKWLGELGADTLAQMVGSESMTSSDWMLLALSCSMSQGSQKAVGEAFVKRLLESGEVHPAVAILLGLGEQDQAIAVYASRKFHFEAVILTCLLFPDAWQRQVMLLREWAEEAAVQGQPEFAARCFACTAYRPSESWTPVGLQDPFVSSHTGHRSATSPNSPPPSSANGRITAKTASLKLITSFVGKESNGAHTTAVGVTPILQSALSPSQEAGAWIRSNSRTTRDPSSARTLTPGTSRGRRMRTAADTPCELEDERTPVLDDNSHVSRHATPRSNPSTYTRTAMHSPAPDRSLESSGSFQVQKPSNGRSQNQLRIDSVVQAQGEDEYNVISSSTASRGRQRRISSGSDRLDHTRSDNTQVRGRSESAYNQSGKRSPSSPVPMTSSGACRHATSSQHNYEDERFYGVPELSLPHLQSPWNGGQSNEGRNSALDVEGKLSKRGRSENRKDEAFLNQSPVWAVDHPSTPLKQGVGDQFRGDGQAPTNMNDATKRPVNTLHQLGNTFQAASINRSKPPALAPNDARMGLETTPRMMSRKELAARELEERRLSLARRPSVPIILHPGELHARPGIGARSITEVVKSASTKPWPSAFNSSPLGAQRSQTVDPEAMMRLRTYNKSTTATLRLPANPNAILQPKYMNAIQQQQPPEAELQDAVRTNGVSTLAALTYQPRVVPRDHLPPLLPSTVFSLKTPLTRSASAPPEKLAMKGSPAARHMRKEFEHTITSSQHQRRPSTSHLPVGVEVVTNDNAIDDDEDVIIVNVSETDPVTVLAELQHLDAPPPPPPPPLMYPPANMYSSPPTQLVHQATTSSSNSVGVINVPMERVVSPPQLQSHSRTGTPARPTPSGSPNFHRRSSVSDTANSIGNKWRNVTERIRSNSKNRAKSPPMAMVEVTFTPPPYETVLGSYQFPRGDIMPGSPPQGAHSMHGGSVAMSPLMEQAVAPDGRGHRRMRSLSGAAVQYRDPKDLRANLPSDQLMGGALQGGMI